MPLFNPSNDEMSLEEKQKLVAKRIKDAVTNNFNQLKSTHESLVKLVFDNRFGLTPQQVFDSLGTEAGKLVALSQALMTFMSSVSGEEVTFTPPVSYTVNEDGTITVNEEPEEEPEEEPSEGE